MPMHLNDVEKLVAKCDEYKKVAAILRQLKTYTDTSAHSYWEAIFSSMSRTLVVPSNLMYVAAPAIIAAVQNAVDVLKTELILMGVDKFD